MDTKRAAMASMVRASSWNVEVAGTYSQGKPGRVAASETICSDPELS